MPQEKNGGLSLRDDIDYASRRLGIHVGDAELVSLVEQKLAVPGNYRVDVSQWRLKAVRQNNLSQLRPVLREKDYSEFDLERAIQTVIGMAENF